MPQTDARRDTLMPRLDEWSVFQAAQPNALLIGPAANAKAAIFRLLPFLRAPVVHWHPRAMAEFTWPPTGALVVWDVDTLDRTQQERLIAWMDTHAAGLQVISVGKGPVFPLVLRQEFIETLYYRLNMVCLSVANQSRRRPQRSLHNERQPGPCPLNSRPARRVRATPLIR
jgi:hypothetical protein